jgi:hypothetical protein
VKIAGYIHPVVQALGPNFSCGWFEILAKLLQTLRRDAGCDCMMIAGEWPYRWARETGRQYLLEGLRVAALDEIALHRKVTALGTLPTTLDQLAYRQGPQRHPALAAIAQEVSRCTACFDADVVISFAVQTDFLAALWPEALRLHMESGAFSRNPYPFSVFFDHLGMYGRSVVGQAGSRLRNHESTDEAKALVGAFRRRNAMAIEAIDPFRAIDFYQKFDRLCLLPLQVSNYYSFDEQACYRTQFEYLVDVLSASPPDVGVLVTEYLEWGHVLKDYGSGQNLTYLQKSFPNLLFFDQFRSYLSPSQYIAPRVDGVWSVSSNVGYQALLYNRLLGSSPSSHLAGVAHATTFDHFFKTLGDTKVVNNDKFLAWFLERYLVPQALLSDGRWLRDYLTRRWQAARITTDPVDAFVPIADLDRLSEAWVLRAPKPVASKHVNQTDAAIAEARAARQSFDAARQSLDAVLHSKSWRITAPLRAFAVALRTAWNYVSSRLGTKEQPDAVLGRPFPRAH